MAESKPFKEYLDVTMAADLARRIGAVAPAFPAEAFVTRVAEEIGPLELKQRSAAMAAALRDMLPADYPAAVTILTDTLGPPLNEQEGMFNDGWFLMPVAHFIELYGLDHPDESLAAIHAVTQRHTGEFAIRPFLVHHQERTLAVLRAWAHDESFHVRRLVSEGSRTRLPWASRLPAFIANPAPVLELLELLKDDPSLYVRRSVANNLNDIVKDHPELVLATLERWSNGANEERRWLIRHALRTLVKQGHPEALRLLGADQATVQLEMLRLSPERVAVGDDLLIAAELVSAADVSQRLVIDYIVHYAGARGERPRRKVFKLRELEAAPGERLRFNKRHSFKLVSVRRYYPGPHRIEIQVNGRLLGGADFELVDDGR